MLKTYFYRKFLIGSRPYIFTQLSIPTDGRRGEVRVSNLPPLELLFEEDFIANEHIEYFLIENYKNVSYGQNIMVRSPDGVYRHEDLFKQNILRFFVCDGEENISKECFIQAPKEAYDQLAKQANHISHEPYLLFLPYEIDLNTSIAHFDNMDIKGLGINIPDNPSLSNIRLKGGQSVNDSDEARQALRNGGQIEYIQFMFREHKIKLYRDFRISFYSSENIEAEIRLIRDIISQYDL